MTSGQSAGDECDRFLQRLEPWARAFLTAEEWDIVATLTALSEPGRVEAFCKVAREYDELLKRCPKHLRQHRKRLVENATQAERNRLLLEFGRTRQAVRLAKNCRTLGRKAAKLYNQGRTWGEVAGLLCLRKSDSKHQCNKLCADRIRNNALPYLGSLKRRRGNSR